MAAEKAQLKGTHIMGGFHMAVVTTPPPSPALDDPFSKYVLISVFLSLLQHTD
jgi:hypothetical protein